MFSRKSLMGREGTPEVRERSGGPLEVREVLELPPEIGEGSGGDGKDPRKSRNSREGPPEFGRVGRAP